MKIDLHQQLFIARRQLAQQGLVPTTKRLGVKLAAFVFQRPRLYNFLGRIARLKLRLFPRWLLYNRLNPWGRQRELPIAPKESFRDQYRREKIRNH